MWLDVNGLNSPCQKFPPMQSKAPTQAEPPAALQRMQREVVSQRALENQVHFSPTAGRLATRQRHLESPSWLSQQMAPSRPARQWTSQFLAQQTWTWLNDAFPGCQHSEQGRTAALQQALREFSPGTHEHSKRVGELALRFANDLGVDQLEQEKLEKGCEFMEAGLLGLQIEAWSTAEREQAATSLRQTGKFHDIGKLAIPDQILHKEGPLTPEERAVIEMHPLVGEAILAEIPGFEDMLPAIRHHHERWDGTGYVDRLIGAKIPFNAQLISLSDTFDALTEDRPYRKAFSPQQACQEILRQRGSQFDPNLAEAFVYMVLSRPA